MVLPLYLAGAREEIPSADSDFRFGWLEASFSSDTPELSGLPDALPPGAMLILTDRTPCGNHDPQRVSQELAQAVAQLGCECVLLDFERPPTQKSRAIVRAISASLPCPVGAPPGYGAATDNPVFLSPAPLHVPLDVYLKPWQGREIWLEAALQQQTITVTRDGTQYSPITPADRQEGFHSPPLLCCFQQNFEPDRAVFTLFDTPETLQEKLDTAAALGVSKAIGLFQELNGK